MPKDGRTEKLHDVMEFDLKELQLCRLHFPMKNRKTK